MTGEPYAGRVAVVGVAGRFPGAGSVASLWTNLLDGVESITRFRPADERAVGAEGLLDGIDRFDAGFFGYRPEEAAVIDPQHRIGMEVAWHAFEDAGTDPCPAGAGVATGVFVSVASSSYLVRNLLPRSDVMDATGGFQVLVHNDKDFAATTLAHQLGLTGPALAVGSACSSSLVAVHLAVQSLLGGECDVALAGGVSIQVPQRQGHRPIADGIYSPSGRCRPFDAAADGTIGGSGAGMVVLKRLDDATAAGDRIRAVIVGSAVNNDGGRSIGYTAPSVDGQLDVIAEALSVGGVSPDSVEFLEAHGTGTPLGDAIEIEAATRAFRLFGERTGYCALGSVKANVGHLDAAAGVTGLITAVLAVQHGRIPPHPTYSDPQRHVDLAGTPFHINTRPLAWSTAGGPRRAGVSSFGIGGTNAHVVVESAEAPGAPEPEPSPDGPEWRLLSVSAESADALDAMSAAVAELLRGRSPSSVAAIAAGLAARRPFSHRRAVAARTGDEAAAALDARVGSTPGPARLRGPVGRRPGRPAPGPDVVFLFPGHGSQHAGMASELRSADPVFRRSLDGLACALSAVGVGLEEELDGGGRPGHAALVAVEYALCETLRERGLEPDAVLGHSVGEYAAAAVAGAAPIGDVLAAVARRERLVAATAPGRMVAVALPAAVLRARLPADLDLAVVNGADSCVVSGATVSVEGFAAELVTEGIAVRTLPGDRAYHSSLIDPVAGEFVMVASALPAHPVSVPWTSTRTGRTVPVGSRPDTDHWPRHLRDEVRFDQAIAGVLAAHPHAVLLEVGPSTVLTDLVRRRPDRTDRQVVMATQPAPGERERRPQSAALLDALGGAWAAGCAVDRVALAGGPAGDHVDLPPYPFRSERHWVDPPGDAAAALVRRTRDRLAELDRAHPVRGIAERPGLAEGLTELCAAVAYDYLARGVDGTEPGSRHDLVRIHERLRVRPEFASLVDTLIDVLVRRGVLARNGDVVRYLDGVRPAAPDDVAAAVRDAHPEFGGLVELVVHCGRHYEAALAEPGAALGVLYPDGRGDLLRRLLGEGCVEFSRTGALIGATAEAVTLAIDTAAASGRRPRVLEVGAGAGRLTWAIADAVGDGPELVVTDVSRAFLDHLGGEAARRGVQLELRTLDLDAEVTEQGFADQGFDAVVGLDVVHATRHVPRTLDRLRRLLRPGGMLAVVETVADDDWLNLVWGLSPDWWHHRDELRGRGPLLAADRWQDAFVAAGLNGTASVPEHPRGSDAVLVTGFAPDAARPDRPLSASDLPDKRPDVAEWGYLPGWRRAGPVAPTGDAPNGPCLVLADGPLGDAVAARLRRASGPVVTVRPGRVSCFDDDAAVWTVATADPEWHDQLVRAFADRYGPPARIVHLWTAGPPTIGNPLDAVAESQRRGLFSVCGLARALADAGRPIRLLVVTSHAQEVLGGELLAPERSTVHAAVKVVPREYPHVACSSMDVEWSDGSEPDELAGAVVAELSAVPETAMVARRGRHRWTPSFTPWRLEQAPSTTRPRAGGVHLIVGGLGGIGLTLAEHLLGLPSTVIVTGRRRFPPRADWDGWVTAHPADDPTGVLIGRLRRAETAGGRVEVLTADVTSRVEMRTAVRRAVELAGPITGVIHAAGVLDTSGVIHRRSDEDTWEAMAAKVVGSLVLDEVMGDQPLEYSLYCSSIGTVLHKLKFGEVGYVAGNEFLDAFARTVAGRRDGACAVSVAWTDWLEAGMWTDARAALTERYAQPASTSGASPSDDLLRALTSAEGVDVFRRVLAHPTPPVVVVSTQDLDALLARHDAFTPADHVGVLDTMQLTSATRTRPDLGAAAVPPRTPIERTVAGIWESLLGVEGVGVHDDFFALGGDSLIALRFLSRLREICGLERSVASLFDHPTIAALLGPDGHDPGHDSGDARRTPQPDRPSSASRDEVVL